MPRRKKRKQVKNRTNPERVLEYNLESWSLDQFIFYFKNSKALFNEFKRQKRKLKRKEEETARLRFLDLFHSLDKNNTLYEFHSLVSSVRLVPCHKDTYKNLHRNILKILESNKRMSSPYSSLSEPFCHVEMKDLLKINKSELQFKTLLFLLNLFQGKTLKELGCRMTKKQIQGMTLKKLLRLQSRL